MDSTKADTVVVGEKRSVDAGGKEDEESVIKTKKMRNGGFESDKEMRRVAEMVLVLSAMANMRGGREPTSAERAIMSEARTKMVAICEDLAPRDIIPGEAFRSVIQDLGIHRPRDHKLATGPPKCSIIQKMELAQRKMAEQKAFSVPQRAVFPSQKLQSGMGNFVESHGTMASARAFTTDKSGHIPISAGNIRAMAPSASSAASEPLPFRPSTHEVQRPATSSMGVPSSSVKRDCSFTMAPSIIHFRSDGKSNGPSYVASIPAVSAGNQHPIRTAAPHLQPWTPALANAETKGKVTDHLMVKPDGNASVTASQSTPQITHVQTAKPVHTPPGTVYSVPHSIPDMHFVHGAPTFNHHPGICMMVQKLLLPKAPEHATWTVPSRDYMNRTLTCQTCKLSLNEVESVLVCDACEKGSHLRCLGVMSQKSIPRGEWHCARCLTISHGKPFPTKYGRVTRNVDAPKVPCNTAGVQPSLGKKPGQASEHVNHQKIIADRSDEKNVSHTPAVAKSSSESNMAYECTLQETDVSFAAKKDVGTNSACCPNNEDIQKGAACSSKSAGSLSDGPTPQDRKPELMPSTVKPLSGMDAFDDTSGSSKQNDDDQAGFVISEAPSQQHVINNEMHKDLHKSNTSKTGECNSSIDEKQHNRGDAEENQILTSAVHAKPVLAVVSENSLRDVDWIGDAIKIVDEKKYYQSCYLDGVGYRVQDYVFCRSTNGKSIPSKIQAMWEDSQTGLKWVIVHLCYFPGDLPEGVAHPRAPDSNEVYESNCESTLRASSIEGPCDVYPPKRFGEENKKVDQVTRPDDRDRPFFICKWFYDESKRVFRPNPAGCLSWR